jgi:hypothetical protein
VGKQKRTDLPNETRLDLAVAEMIEEITDFSFVKTPHKDVGFCPV